MKTRMVNINEVADTGIHIYTGCGEFFGKSKEFCNNYGKFFILVSFVLRCCFTHHFFYGKLHKKVDTIFKILNENEGKNEEM